MQKFWSKYCVCVNELFLYLPPLRIIKCYLKFTFANTYVEGGGEEPCGGGLIEVTCSFSLKNELGLRYKEVRM